MRTLNQKELADVIGGGAMSDLGYAVGYGIGYVLGGGAGRDLGSWLYDITH